MNLSGSLRTTLFVFACLPHLHAANYAITVAGLGGEPEYEQRFSQWAAEIDKTLKASGPDWRVHTLSASGATRTAIRDTVAAVAREAVPEDSVIVMLIGHGTFDGTEYKVNLPGPDMTAAELGQALNKIAAKRQLIVNMTSASGASLQGLQNERRVVITATKSGTEKNATIFARYWVDALRDASADADKNEVISALEAFRFAEQKTKHFYESSKRLATEHAQLEGGEQHGQLAAARFPLLRIGAIQTASQNPAKQAQLAKREQLEQQIDQLKFQKAAMPADEYKKQISRLLLELARTQAELDK